MRESTNAAHVVRADDVHAAHFVQVDREFALDPDLSARAKGLYLVLGALDGQPVNVAELARRSADGEASVKRGLQSLEETGYLTREQVRGEGGRMIGVRYVIHARPQVAPPDQHTA